MTLVECNVLKHAASLLEKVGIHHVLHASAYHDAVRVAHDMMEV